MKNLLVLCNLVLFSLCANAQEACEYLVEVEVQTQNIDEVSSDPKIKELAEKYGEITFVVYHENDSYMAKCTGSTAEFPAYRDNLPALADEFVEDLKATNLFSFVGAGNHPILTGDCGCPYGVEVNAVINDGVDLKNNDAEEKLQELQEKYSNGLSFFEYDTVFNERECHINWVDALNEIILADCGVAFQEDLEKSGLFKKVSVGSIMPTEIPSVVKSNMSISPNPVTDILTVNYFDNFTFSIVNINGQVVMTGIAEGTQINVSQLKQGSYFLQIGKETVKFVKL